MALRPDNISCKVSNPRAALWFGTANRRRVLGIYGCLIAMGFVVQAETGFLQENLLTRERHRIAQLYEQLGPGFSTEQVKAAMQSVDANIAFHFGDNTPFAGTAGFPYDGTPTPTIEIEYPALPSRYGTKPRIIVLMSERPPEPGAIARRLVLIEKGTIVDMKPPLTPDTPRILKGILTTTPGSETFAPCGVETPRPADLSRTGAPVSRNGKAGAADRQPRRRCVIVSGAMPANSTCSDCRERGRGFEIRRIIVRAKAGSNLCKCEDVPAR